MNLTDQRAFTRKATGVWVIARAVARRGKAKQLRSLLRGMIAPTHAERGCLIYDLYEAEDPGSFYFYELWATRRDLKRHAASSHFRFLQKALSKLARRPLEVGLLKKVPPTHNPSQPKIP
jgi:quinol monooxygenase YgiN